MPDDPATPADLWQINAELRRERDEALAREAAMAEVLQVINSSSGDLGPGFDAMLEKAMRLCEAACGVICRFDGKLFYPGAARGNPRFIERIRRRGPWDATAGFTFGRVVAGEHVVHITDVTNTPAFHESVARRPGTLGTTRGSRSASCALPVSRLKISVHPDQSVYF
jgi:two-component system, NtrC family, sensor kinase